MLEDINKEGELEAAFPSGTAQGNGECESAGKYACGEKELPAELFVGAYI